MTTNVLTQITTKRNLSDDEKRVLDGGNIGVAVDLLNDLNSGEYISLMELSSGETHIAFKFLRELRAYLK